MDVDREGPPVNRDRELLARKMSGADLRAHADMPEADRVGGRTEVKRAAIEHPIYRADDRPAIRGDRGQRQQAHSVSRAATSSAPSRRSGVWMRSRCAPADR